MDLEQTNIRLYDKSALSKLIRASACWHDDGFRISPVIQVDIEDIVGICNNECNNEKVELLPYDFLYRPDRKVIKNFVYTYLGYSEPSDMLLLLLELTDYLQTNSTGLTVRLVKEITGFDPFDGYKYFFGITNITDNRIYVRFVFDEGSKR